MNKYILTVSDEKTTRTLANILMLCIGLFCVVLLLNELDIFVVEKNPMRIVSVIFAVIMAFPKAALIIRKKYENWMKYATIMCASIAICLAYSVLTYHMIMPLVFPLILSVMYFDNRLTIFTAIETAIFMTAAHIISASLFVVDDPLHTLRRILVYGLLPRLLNIHCLCNRLHYSRQ